MCDRAQYKTDCPVLDPAFDKDNFLFSPKTEKVAAFVLCMGQLSIKFEEESSIEFAEKIVEINGAKSFCLEF